MRATDSVLAAAILMFGCDEDSPDDPAGTVGATDTAPPTTGASAPTTDPTDASASGSAEDSDDPTDPELSTSSGAGGSTGESAGGSSESGEGSTDAGTGDATDFHPEFAWFADFVREKCVPCHNMGQNGNLLLPSIDMTNEEVRIAVDGVEATTGRLIVDPFNSAESQAYVMITNSAGEQFPPETTDRVAAWIDLGAPYYEE